VIVRSASGSLVLITQPDHAQLARQIMEHCAPLSRAPRCDVILRAIGVHDDGWTEEDAAPRVDRATGGVADFVSAAVEVRQAVWPRCIAGLGDPWAAALVAQHALTVYDRFRSDGAWRDFFAGMERTRDRLVRTSGLTIDHLAADYPYLRLGDLISLTFCAGTSYEGPYAGWTVGRSGSSVTVTPDPFGGAVIPILIAAKSMADQRFASDEELRDAYRSAAAVQLNGEVSGPR
jgi:hypothetical protein